MSGIEVVGLLLGAFPLAIAAMEHIEESKKVAGTFFKIRRTFRRDLGKLKDCQLKFRLNLKELLLPLLADDQVTSIEYERLLSNPGGDGWKDEHVEEALLDRLGECKERYVEILKELEEIMVDLCKAMKVDDEQFQALLHDKSTDKAQLATGKARNLLMLRANAAFQRKRVLYAFSGNQRETLLAEVDQYNQRLEDILSANDRVSAIQPNNYKTPKPRIPKALLNFWRHADAVFRLISDAWKCQCRTMHCAHLRLQHRIERTTGRDVDIKIIFKYCHGEDVQDSPWKSQPLQIKLAGRTETSIPFRPRAARGKDGPRVLIAGQNNLVERTDSGYSSICVATQRPSTTSAVSEMQTPSVSVVGERGLCGLISTKSTSSATTECLGSLVDDNNDHRYDIFHTGGHQNSESVTTLAEILCVNPVKAPTRVQRYSIALTLASSHVQLQNTPWLNGVAWTASDVRFPATTDHDSDNDRPYILSTFDHGKQTSHMAQNLFSSLGIVLLELCFGRLLDSHVLWSQPGFEQSKHNPMFRQFIASEWLKEVEGEAGENYAAAVRWCLHQAPSPLSALSGANQGVTGEKWRADFAENVVLPLQMCYESMLPRRYT